MTVGQGTKVMMMPSIRISYECRKGKLRSGNGRRVCNSTVGERKTCITKVGSVKLCKSREACM